MATIYDIAKKVNLSPSTVARALSGKGYISDKSLKKVLQAAKELNYVPMEAAQILKNNITNKIMLCIPDIMNPYYFSMIDGVTKALSKYNYNMILSYTEHSPSKELEIINSLKGKFVDGIIFGSFDYSKILIDALKNTGLPVVITSFYDNDENNDFFDCVYVDQPKASEIATEALIKKGHKRILFVGGSAEEQNTVERYKGYKTALENNNIMVDKKLILNSNFTRKGGQRVVKEFLEKNIDITAVIACNDLMAVGAFNSLRDKKHEIPDDISIVSLDNTDYCVCLTPRLSSVNMMQKEVGETAVSRLMERIQNIRSKQQNVLFTPKLVKRESIRKIK